MIQQQCTHNMVVEVPLHTLVLALCIGILQTGSAPVGIRKNCDQFSWRSEFFPLLHHSSANGVTATLESHKIK